MTTASVPIVEIARLYDYVREIEGEQNAGQRVEAIQKWGGGEKGQSWCAYMATKWVDMYFKGHAPIPRTGSCDEILNLARANGWLSERPHVGDLYLFLKSPTDAHHVGLVSDVTANGFRGIAGNTSEDGKSSNGTGVFEHDFALHPGTIVFVAYPR
jgi:hypothetical protein